MRRVPCNPQCSLIHECHSIARSPLRFTNFSFMLVGEWLTKLMMFFASGRFAHLSFMFFCFRLFKFFDCFFWARLSVLMIRVFFVCVLQTSSCRFNDELMFFFHSSVWGVPLWGMLLPNRDWRIFCLVSSERGPKIKPVVVGHLLSVLLSQCSLLTTLILRRTFDSQDLDFSRVWKVRRISITSGSP